MSIAAQPSRSRWTPSYVLWCLFIPFYAVATFSVLIPLSIAGQVLAFIGGLGPVKAIGGALRPLWDGLWRFVGRPFLKDERAASIIPYMLMPIIWIPMLVELHYNFRIELAYVYWLVLMGPHLAFYAGYTAISHHNAHIPGCFFKKPLEGFQWYLVEYFLGPFHGTVPGSFPYSHSRMHHVCDNNAEDPSSTLYYQRDSLHDFLRYAMGPAFLYVSGVSALVYFHKKGRKRTFRQMLAGFVLYYGTFAGMLVFDWKLAIVAMGMPLLLNVMAFSIINWGEHGFADPADYDNMDTNTSTIIGPQLPLNENHHYAHHMKPANQWTRDPDYFEAQIERLQHLDAPVFQGVNWGDLWKMMVSRNYEGLAKHYVILNKNRRPEEIPALLRERMQRNLDRDAQPTSARGAA